MNEIKCKSCGKYFNDQIGIDNMLNYGIEYQCEECWRYEQEKKAFYVGMASV